MNGHEHKFIIIRDYTPEPQHVCVNARGGRRCDVCFGPIEEQWQDWPAAGTEPEWYTRGMGHVDHALALLDSIKEPPVPVYELPKWAIGYLGLLAGFVAVWWFT